MEKDGVLDGGTSAGNGASASFCPKREFLPNALRVEQALLREALGPVAADCSNFLNFFRLVDRHLDSVDTRRAGPGWEIR